MSEETSFSPSRNLLILVSSLSSLPVAAVLAKSSISLIGSAWSLPVSTAHSRASSNISRANQGLSTPNREWASLISS